MNDWLISGWDRSLQSIIKLLGGIIGLSKRAGWFQPLQPPTM